MRIALASMAMLMLIWPLAYKLILFFGGADIHALSDDRSIDLDRVQGVERLGYKLVYLLVDCRWTVGLAGGVLLLSVLLLM